jgi:hypothetical protein
MDVYQKVLTRLFELTDGKDSVDVDLAELLKKEGFYPSIDNIRDYMSSESWIAETSRTNIIRITHWGVAAAKKALSSAPDTALALEKDANRLVSSSKEFLVMVEEFASSPSEDKFKPIEDRFSELSNGLQRIKANL